MSQQKQKSVVEVIANPFNSAVSAGTVRDAGTGCNLVREWNEDAAGKLARRSRSRFAVPTLQDPNIVQVAMTEVISLRGEDVHLGLPKEPTNDGDSAIRKAALVHFLINQFEG